MRYPVATLIAFMIACVTPYKTCAQAQKFCFEMLTAKGSTRVTITFANEHWKTGYVQYAGQKDSIAIRSKGRTLLHSYRDHPDDAKYDFEELVMGRATGLYSFSLQGASFHDAYYLRYRDKKKFPLARPNVPDEDCFSDL